MRIGDYQLLLGADPEVFAVTKNGQPVSAHDMIPGSKENPHKVDLGMIQPDGLAAEFGIRPAKTVEGFRTRIRKVRQVVERQLAEHDAQILIRPSLQFPKDYYDSLPNHAKELGCDPDYNAYTRRPNPAPEGGDTGFRAAGGHVHFGWTNDQDVTNPHHFEACVMLTKMLDLYLGVPFVLLDSDSDRRRMYGRAGSFRPKSYGMEYRVLSNAWLRHKDLMTFVYNQSTSAFQNLLEDKIPDYYGREDSIQGIINNSCEVMAYYMCENFGFKWPKPPKKYQRKKPLNSKLAQ